VDADSSARSPLHGVATPAPDTRLDSGHRRRCGRQIERPRPCQKACSSRCRFALWKAAQGHRASGMEERHREAYALLKEALRILRAPEQVT
jgi:hypothetical protein